MSESPACTLVTAGRAAQILGLADRRAAHRLVAEGLLCPFGGWTLEGVGQRRQLTFRLVDVRALLIRRAERLTRKPPARSTAGAQLAFSFPPATVATVLPWLQQPRMLKASLKQRLEAEGRAKARRDGRPVKGARNPKESHRVA